MERDSRRVTLSHPVEAHGETLTELVIQEPTARDFESMDRGKGQIQQVHHLLASCAKVPYSTILSLRVRDYQAAMGALAELGFQEAAEPLTESSDEFPETGLTPSES